MKDFSQVIFESAIAGLGFFLIYKGLETLLQKPLEKMCEKDTCGWIYLFLSGFAFHMLIEYTGFSKMASTEIIKRM
jgi:hypothetical protein